MEQVNVFIISRSCLLVVYEIPEKSIKPIKCYKVFFLQIVNLDLGPYCTQPLISSTLQ